MITYTRNEPNNFPAYYACVSPEGYMVGVLDQLPDGFYYFLPTDNLVLTQDDMFDIYMKLKGINAAWEEKLKTEGVK